MLESISTKAPEEFDKDLTKENNKELGKRIAELQRVMYAQAKHSLLIILQGVDASGKDGAIREIFKRVNPQGCRVKSFKKPNEVEFAHDFLWRIHANTPRKGMIQIFNRSHYEDILVPTVEQTLPMELVEERYQLINNFEKLLAHNGTTILKFYLHVSHEEQLTRLHERLHNPQKHWKHQDGDWEARAQWDEYMSAYETIFERCNDPEWIIVPSDQNWYKVQEISRHIIQAMETMDLEWPDLDSERFGNNNGA